MTRQVRGTASSLRIRSVPFVGTDTDTGSRLASGQIAITYGESWDGKWQFIVTSSAWGWVSADYLEPDLEPAPVPAVPTAKPVKYTLEGEDPELTAKVDKLRDMALAEGIEFTTADFGGVRTEADTRRIMKYRDDDYAVYVRKLKAGNPNAKPVPIGTWRPINAFGTSKHNYGCARDLRITKRPASFSEGAAMSRVGKLATKLGLIWGGNFKRVDTPHVELPITLAQARQRYEVRGRLAA